MSCRAFLPQPVVGMRSGACRPAWDRSRTGSRHVLLSRDNSGVSLPDLLPHGYLLPVPPPPFPLLHASPPFPNGRLMAVWRLLPKLPVGTVFTGATGSAKRPGAATSLALNRLIILPDGPDVPRTSPGQGMRCAGGTMNPFSDSPCTMTIPFLHECSQCRRGRIETLLVKFNQQYQCHLLILPEADSIDHTPSGQLLYKLWKKCR